MSSSSSGSPTPRPSTVRWSSRGGPASRPSECCSTSRRSPPSSSPRAMAERYGLDHLDLGVFKVDMSAANLLSAAAAKRYNAVPVSYVDEHTLLLAMVGPGQRARGRRHRAADPPRRTTGRRLGRRTSTALIMRMNRFDAAVTEAVEEDAARPRRREVVDLRETADDAPVIKLVNSIIAAGHRAAAPRTSTSSRDGRREMRVRLRVDGVLTESTTVPEAHGRRRRLAASRSWPTSTSPSGGCPQDGRVGLTIDGRPSTSASPRSPASTARASSCASSTRRASSSSSTRSASARSERHALRDARFTAAYGSVLIDRADRLG